MKKVDDEGLCVISWLPLTPCIACVQYRGGYLEYRGATQYRGGFNDARGGYHEYRGGVQNLGGINLLLFEYPTVLNTPTVLMISPTCIMHIKVSPKILIGQ